MLPTRHILLIEDDADDQLIFSGIIRDLYPQVLLTIADNGEDGLRKLSRIHPVPDIIFLDINMPLMNGFECLQELKKEPGYKDIPVFILSTNPGAVAVMTAKKLGANGYLTKPYHPLALKENLHRVLNMVFTVPAEQWSSDFMQISTHLV